MEQTFDVKLMDPNFRRRHVTKVMSLLWPSPSTQDKWDSCKCQAFLNLLLPDIKNYVLYARRILVLQAMNKGQIECNIFFEYVKNTKPEVDMEVHDFFDDFEGFDVSTTTVRRMKFRDLIRSLANRETRSLSAPSVPVSSLPPAQQSTIIFDSDFSQNMPVSQDFSLSESNATASFEQLSFQFPDDRFPDDSLDWDVNTGEMPELQVDHWGCMDGLWHETENTVNVNVMQQQYETEMTTNLMNCLH